MSKSEVCHNKRQMYCNSGLERSLFNRLECDTQKPANTDTSHRAGWNTFCESLGNRTESHPGTDPPR